jgi:hypothetical protein
MTQFVVGIMAMQTESFLRKLMQKELTKKIIGIMCMKIQ